MNVISPGSAALDPPAAEVPTTQTNAKPPESSPAVGAARRGAGRGRPEGLDAHGSSRAALAREVNFYEALQANRLHGKWNWGTSAIGRLPFGGKKNRLLLEAHIADARKLLDSQRDVASDSIDPQVAKKIREALGGAKAAVEKFDGFVDDFTECVATIITGFLCKWAWERASARHEVRTGKRLEATFKGEWLMQFPLQSAVYFATMAAARGRNFIKEVQPDLKLKTNWAWIIAEVLAIPIMVIGTNQGAKLIKKHSDLHQRLAKLTGLDSDFCAEFLAAIPSGGASSLECYAVVNSQNPLASGTRLPKAVARGALWNTPARFTSGGLMKRREKRKAKQWARKNGIPDLSPP